MINYLSFLLASLLVCNSVENIIYLQSNPKKTSDWIITYKSLNQSCEQPVFQILPIEIFSFSSSPEATFPTDARMASS